MDAIEKIVADDVGRDGGLPQRVVAFNALHDAIVEDVVAQGLNGSLIEDQTGKSSIVKRDVAGRFDDDRIVALIDQ